MGTLVVLAPGLVTEVLPHLADALNDENLAVQGAARQSMGLMLRTAPRTTSDLSHLTGLLNDAGWDVQGVTLQPVQKLVRAAPGATGPLSRLAGPLKVAHLDVLDAARQPVQNLVRVAAPGDSAPLSYLAGALSERSYAVGTIKGLKKNTSGDAAAWLPHLVGALKNKNQHVRNLAMEELV